MSTGKNASNNDVTDTSGMQREALLQNENEYLLKKITEELKTWTDNNTNSAKYTAISIVISAIALLFGVVLFIFEKSSYRQEIKNIISTSVIGSGGSVTLFGSLASLNNLIKQANEDKKEFEKTLESFKDLFKDPTKKKDETIFKKIDIILISFSAYCLFHSISVMICIQIIIPSVTETMLNPDYLESFEKYCLLQDISEDDKFKKYSSTVRLRDLFGFLCYRIHKDKLFIRIIDIIKYVAIILFFPIFIIIGLITVEIPSLKVKFKRISLGKIEFEGINRVRYGLPLNKNYLIKQKKEEKDLEIKRIREEKENESDPIKRNEIQLKLEEKYDELLELNEKLAKRIKNRIASHKNKKADSRKSKNELYLEDAKQKLDPDLNIQKLKLDCEIKILDLVIKEIKLNQIRLEIEKETDENFKLKNIPNDNKLEDKLKQRELVNEEIKKLDQIKQKLVQIKQGLVQIKQELNLKQELELVKVEDAIEAIKKFDQIKQELDQNINELNLKKQELVNVKDAIEKLKKVNVKDAIEKLEEVKKKVEQIKEKENQKLLEIVNEAIKVVKDVIKAIEKLESEIFNKIEKLDLKKLKKIRNELKKEKIELIDSKLKNIDSKLKNKKLDSKDKKKLKLELKEKALELVKINIKSIQDELDSEKNKGEPKLIDIKNPKKYEDSGLEEIRKLILELESKTQELWIFGFRDYFPEGWL
ncbi:7740_t:CDS:2 [Gigaspora margarita]|uniref:7740_t:CDS:1 n=1 Tax=Gigaspora margarita TaxID=4874 RepID=A0ABN7UU08_GIGMA|nr:7740_t:CDS:2 [Gigaspora margarita]